jgi:hypothetical protein
MQLPILQTGAAGWKAGHRAIQRGTFVFRISAEDTAYADLKRFAVDEARRFLATRYPSAPFTPDERTRLLATYAHAFVNGAFDECVQQGAGGKP